jgi:hypothetical protein
MNNHPHVDRHRKKYEENVEHHRNHDGTLALLVGDERKGFRSGHNSILRCGINFDTRLKLADTYNVERMGARRWSG